ncbi:PDR/VanB family oxidoreductase [Paraburkholderia sp.]|jgi:vanillate O-demethylase ferredoxin subunit|uniref:PDR/VanB family oxidoreductase n=1 Tax=Paraburkholderia sp. TaxID=1926495 RepID=UPI00286EF929|nr:PDR/VanB family oxidoreductase [Paraburkholderia sp.]
MNLHDASAAHLDMRLSLRVAAREDIAQDIVAFDLEAADYLPLPGFEAGAHIEIDCGGVARQYSLCGDPRAPERWRIAVQREAEGRGGSRFLCEQVKVGDTLDARGPRNLFPLVPGTARALLIAGGIGLTPMLSMAWALHSAAQDFALYAYASAPERQPFADALVNMPWAARVTQHIGRGAGFADVVGAFEPGRHLYVCGPFAMIDAVLDTALALGWPEDHLHCERFAAPLPNAAAQADRAPDTAFEVELASSGKRIHVAAEQSVCDALGAAGVYVPVSCGEGVCGSCATRVLAGTPEHRDWCLSAEQQAANTLFTPCCSRAASPLLVLDL